jgi:hypothetical protein
MDVKTINKQQKHGLITKSEELKLSRKARLLE